MSDDTMESRLREIEKTLELPNEFLDEMEKENDWSLVIKAHAIIEAILTEVISSALESKEIELIVSRLEFNNVRRGKLAVAKALELVDQDDLEFINILCELRNQLVHSVDHFSFNFESHLKGLDEARGNRFIKMLVYFNNNKSVNETTGNLVSDDAKANPQRYFYVSFLNFIAVMLEKLVIRKATKKLAELKKEQVSLGIESK